MRSTHTTGRNFISLCHHSPKKKRVHNRVVVDESVNDDNSVIAVTQAEVTDDSDDDMPGLVEDSTHQIRLDDVRAYYVSCTRFVDCLSKYVVKTITVVRENKQ